jgi:lysophospholipase L1-like esterase
MVAWRGRVARKRLFLLGDSISVRYGPYLEQMAASRFVYARKQATPNAPDSLPYPADANGGDSSQVLSYLQRALDRHAPDVLVLNCGLHDLRTDPQTGTKQVPLPLYRENLLAIVRLLQGRTTEAVWVRTTPVEDSRHNTSQMGFQRFDRDVVQYNDVADAVWGGAGVPVVDLYAFTRSLGEKLFCDHVHFCEPVCRLQAAFIAGHLFARRL